MSARAGSIHITYSIQENDGPVCGPLVPQLDGLDEFLDHDLFLLAGQLDELVFGDHLKTTFAGHAFVDLEHVHVLQLTTSHAVSVSEENVTIVG